MVKTYVRPPPMFVKGEGCYLWDVENRKYLDFTAGIAVNALGHCDPEMSKLMAQQVNNLHYPSYQSDYLFRPRHSSTPRIYTTIHGLALSPNSLYKRQLNLGLCTMPKLCLFATLAPKPTKPLLSLRESQERLLTHRERNTKLYPSTVLSTAAQWVPSQLHQTPNTRNHSRP